ncbi:vWA domain-containing protein [Deinococcus pimensis]|uniref:vWA domain-containing protein n=1 Tax=Deinococcus pimensis TaxID=309888 RepID=UPI000480AF34|nr:VWA-like domain-containing protein [Deinococcus pimensis]
MPRPFEQRIQKAIIELRSRNPFYGVLVMYADPRLATHVGAHRVLTACADGRGIYFDAAFAERLSDDELTGVLVHETLHNALLHCVRMGGRDRERWNVAADIVVNAVAEHDGYTLPRGAARDPRVQHLSVEEIYELLASGDLQGHLPLEARDVLPAGPGGPSDEAGPDGESRLLDRSARERLEAYWKDAVRNAATTARLAGALPLGARRVVGEGRPGIDWRAALWRSLTPSRTDFGEFDRRHVHRGLYVEDLASHEVDVAICVDTSGSVGERELGAFLSEVRGILGSYPHVRATLYWADVALHGPFELDHPGGLPAPHGGGGTDFRPFFERTRDVGVRVYLTDGHGRFPQGEQSPPGRTLWAVTPGGLASEAFPFGEVLRIVG